MKVIASYPLCNVASLNIYEAEEDRVLVAMNDDEPRWLKTYVSSKGVYINYKKIRYYLGEFIRTDI